MLRARTVSALCTVFALSLSAAAVADNDKGKGKGKSKGKGHDGSAVVVKERDRGRGGSDAVVVFHDRDRDTVRTYWVETYGRGNCPPGLAKKNNGCLPPGLAKKRYLVGQRLSTAVVVQPLPPVLVTRLGPPPSGYQYVVVDGDVVKLALGTRLVVDAITALTR
jgi:Ni/Co efflux regulator RcnB